MPLPKCKRIDVDDRRAAAALLDDGWREIEKLVTYERHPVRIDPVLGVRPVEDWERRAILGLAAGSFSEDRLHKDPEIDDDEADRFKVECVERAFEEKLPILTYGWPTTFAFLIYRLGKKVSTIDLIAVHPDARRQGIAKKLIASFLSESVGSAVCRAGTQAHNTPSVKMYLSLGFREVRRERTFHKP